MLFLLKFTLLITFSSTGAKKTETKITRTPLTPLTLKIKIEKSIARVNPLFVKNGFQHHTPIWNSAHPATIMRCDSRHPSKNNRKTRIQNHTRAPIYSSLEPYPTANLKRNPLKNRTLRPKISGLWSENRDIGQHFCIFEMKITPVLPTFYLTNSDFSGTLKAVVATARRVALRSF